MSIIPRLSIWQHLKGSLSSASYYFLLASQPLSSSLLTFALGMVLSGLFFTVYLYRFGLPSIQLQTVAGLEQLAEWYPDTVTVTLSDNQLQVVPDNEYSIDFPPAWKGLEVIAPQLALYQPEEILELSQHPYSDYWLVLTPQQLHIQNTTSNWSSIVWSDLQLTTPVGISKPTVKETAQNIAQSFHQAVPLFLLLSMILSPIFITLSTLATGLLELFLLYLVFRLNGYTYSVTTTLQIGLHLLMVSQIITQAALALAGSLPLPLFSVTFWILVTYIFILQLHRVRLGK